MMKLSQWVQSQNRRALEWMKSWLPQANDDDWRRRETGHDRVLRRLGDELAPQQDGIPDDARMQRFFDELGERAETYFAGLWASCSIDERVLLYQLARNGFLNSKDRKLVRRLMARRFIRRDPNIQLFSESFRRHVLRAGASDNLKVVAATLRPSRWKDLRLGLAVLVLAFVLMLFATQKDAFTTAQTLVGSLTASIPLVIKVIGMVTEKRGDATGQS